MAHSGDDEDEDLRQAIALSLQADEASAVQHSPEADGVNGKASDVIKGIDRKAMEQERLAREESRKRQRPISPPLVEDDRAAALKRPRRVATTNKCSPALRFPHGVVKKTFSPRHPNDPGIKIEEIFDKDNLKTAVLSTFMIDPDWVFSKLNIRATKFYMILHASDERTRKMYIDDFSGLKNAKLCMPRLSGGYSSMHSKLMLLFFEDFLRIAIPSANLVDYDWGETGVMENTVFLIDLPRITRDKQKIDRNGLTFFGHGLLNFLQKQGVDEPTQKGILNFDFTPTERFAFVHTAAGHHFGSDMHRTGFTGLSAAVRHLSLQTNDPIRLDYAASSLGSLHDGTINAIYAAAQGRGLDNPAWLKKPNEETLQNMRIYFPTRETVHKSYGGFDSAGTICLQKKYYNQLDFPRRSLRNHVSTRPAMLSHSKIILVRGKDIAWAYVGSANLSESAWGRLTMDRAKKEAKLFCSNWECGVMIPATSTLSADVGEVFKDVLDVPFDVGEDLAYKGRQPWLFKEHEDSRRC